MKGINKIKTDTKGSITLEASVVLPVFMFFVLALIFMLRTISVRSVIYEAGTETAEYLAEYAYLEDNTDIPTFIDHVLVYKKFSDYLDDKKLVEDCVSGGVAGITFIGSSLPSEDGYIHLRITFCLKVQTAFRSFIKPKSFVITQKCYLGYDKNECKKELSDDEIYVYLADNSSVYHRSAGCTYIRMNVTQLSKSSAVSKRLKPCEFCGRKAGGIVYVTEYGERYHGSSSCSRIRRNIRTVRLSEVKGRMPACSKCSGG